MTVGLGVLIGIIAFLVVEKLQRLFIGEGGHGHRNGVQFNKFSNISIKILIMEKVPIVPSSTIQ